MSAAQNAFTCHVHGNIDLNNKKIFNIYMFHGIKLDQWNPDWKKAVIL